MKKLIEENVQYINSYKNICEWQKSKIKNLEDEILRLKTNLNGSQLVLQESIKEYMDEIVSKTDQINELKNTIEKQEIMIDKMKNCELTKLAAAKIVLKNLKKNPIYYTTIS